MMHYFLVLHGFEQYSRNLQLELSAVKRYGAIFFMTPQIFIFQIAMLQISCISLSIVFGGIVFNRITY